MAAFQPPPTYADPVVVDEKTKKGKFNPIWLKWFLDLVNFINSSGGGGGAVSHNSTSGLQGGTTNQYYHLTLAEWTALTTGYTTAPSGITVGASPFTYHNTATQNVSVIVQGGTVSKVEFSRDNSTFYDCGVVAGMLYLSPGDYLKVTYTGAPTMTLIPR